MLGFKHIDKGVVIIITWPLSWWHWHLMFVTSLSIPGHTAQTQLKVLELKEHFSEDSRRSLACWTLHHYTQWFSSILLSSEMFCFQIIHYLAFKYAEQRKEHLRNLNLFCNLQMYATLILNLIYFKGFQRILKYFGWTQKNWNWGLGRTIATV